jgi:hypothetical protein
MLYQPNETKTSKKQLEIVFQRLKDETCLIGGWAVYHLVNSNFKKATGRDYVGSRDIDIGFNIEEEWNEEQLRNSEFAAAIRTIEEMRFKSVSIRIGDYRAIYQIDRDKNQVVILFIGHRRTVYDDFLKML